MPREVAVYLEDILEACRKINHYTEGMPAEQFRGDDKRGIGDRSSIFATGTADWGQVFYIRHRVVFIVGGHLERDQYER